MNIEFSWQSTPQLWMATRPDLCWCEECSRKNARGFGKTQEDAALELLEDESSRD